jgi:hypothetical protein
MSEPRSTAHERELEPAPEPDGRPTVGVYDAPERPANRLPMTLIFVVIAIILAVVVAIWLF